MLTTGAEPNVQRPAAVVALFDAGDDTITMIHKLLVGTDQALVGCRFYELKKGLVSCAAYLDQYDPEVVIVEISPPYDENWEFFKAIRDSITVEGRGLIVTTTNKDQLDKAAGGDSPALEVVGDPANLKAIQKAITIQTRKARLAMRPPCPEKTQLLALHHDSKLSYSDAAAILPRHIGITSKVEYETLHRNVEHLRLKTSEARKQLLAHVAKHGC